MYDVAGFTHDKMIHTMPNETYDIIMKIQVRAPFRLIRAAAPYFRVKSNPAENRSIINVSSTSGLHGNVGQANYRRRPALRHDQCSRGFIPSKFNVVLENEI
ncbi:hypothetical protein BD769DRAFT_809297 [Suillus cothurnatus]|nr:hypothetical protein BD769DRAFT_809297 [Suillus cothurnatus]